MATPSATLFAILLPLAFAAGAPLPHAPAPRYDEMADAGENVRRALEEARRSRRSVIVLFGANWCADCRLLDSALRAGPSARLVQRDFRIVKVDVGQFDRNVELAASFGIALKDGIPALAILSPEGGLVYATRAGELADARGLGEDGIYRLLRQVVRAR
jgi:protein disulfide-isomerase